MTKPLVGGTKHRWLLEDGQALIRELSASHRAAIENLRRENRNQAILDLAQAGHTLVSLQRVIGEMRLLTRDGEK